MSRVYYSNFDYIMDCVTLSDEKITEHRHIISTLKSDMSKVILDNVNFKSSDMYFASLLEDLARKLKDTTIELTYELANKTAILNIIEEMKHGRWDKSYKPDLKNVDTQTLLKELCNRKETEAYSVRSGDTFFRVGYEEDENK